MTERSSTPPRNKPCPRCGAEEGGICRDFDQVKLRCNNVSDSATPRSQSLATTEAEYTIGKYTITDGRQKGRVAIYHESGEGGDFAPAMLEAVIAKFYGENF